jgi:hypothetical protein
LSLAHEAVLDIDGGTFPLDGGPDRDGTAAPEGVDGVEAQLDHGVHHLRFAGEDVRRGTGFARQLDVGRLQPRAAQGDGGGDDLVQRDRLGGHRRVLAAEGPEALDRLDPGPERLLHLADHLAGRLGTLVQPPAQQLELQRQGIEDVPSSPPGTQVDPGWRTGPALRLC